MSLLVNDGDFSGKVVGVNQFKVTLELKMFLSNPGENCFGKQVFQFDKKI